MVGILWRSQMQTWLKGFSNVLHLSVRVGAGEFYPIKNILRKNSRGHRCLSCYFVSENFFKFKNSWCKIWRCIWRGLVCVGWKLKVGTRGIDCFRYGWSHTAQILRFALLRPVYLVQKSFFLLRFLISVRYVFVCFTCSLLVIFDTDYFFEFLKITSVKFLIKTVVFRNYVLKSWAD